MTIRRKCSVLVLILTIAAVGSVLGAPAVDSIAGNTNSAEKLRATGGSNVGAQPTATSSAEVERSISTKGDGKQKTAAQIVRHATAAYRKIDSATGVVKEKWTVGRRTRVTKANVAYERPGNVRIDFRSPNTAKGTTFVSNEEGVLFYDSSRNTAYEMTSGGSAKTNRAGIAAATELDGLRKTLKRSNVTYRGRATVNGRNAYVLHVSSIPGHPGRTETVYLDRQSYRPLKVKLSFEYRGRHVTSTTTVSKFTVNPCLSDDTFAYQPPSDATVVQTSNLQKPVYRFAKSLFTGGLSNGGDHGNHGKNGDQRNHGNNDNHGNHGSDRNHGGHGDHGGSSKQP